MQMQLHDAKNLSGYLEKKSPSMIVGYQKRFFVIVDDGQILAYLEKDSDKTPKGSIRLNQITKINKSSTIVTDFEIIYGEKNFQLRAENEQVRDEWYEKLNILWDDQLINNRSRGSSTTAHKMIDKDTLKEIRKKKELEEMQSQEANLEQINNQMMSMTGMSIYLNDIDQNVFNLRYLAGNLGKQGKGLSKYQKRWCIIVSGMPIIQTNVIDGQIITNNDLPPWMELDTMYYFSEDSAEPKGNIVLKNCLSVDEIDNKDEFEFKLNMGDRIYVFSSQTQVMRDKWVEGIKKSMKNCKGVQKDNILAKKNIDKAIAAFQEDQKEQEPYKLQNYIDEVINQIRQKEIKNLEIDNYDNLMRFINPLKDELVDVLKCCFAKKPHHTELATQYIKILHEFICEQLQEFWDGHYENLDALTNVQLSYWVFKFKQEIELFFDDPRLEPSYQLLLNIYLSKTLENVESMITNIVEIEFNSDPEQTEEGKLQTQSAFDIFKIINECFDAAINNFPSKEVGSKLLEFACQLIKDYQDQITEAIEADIYQPQQLVAICNNAIIYQSFIKQYAQKIQEQIEADQEEIENQFQQRLLIQQFVKVGQLSQEKLLEFLFQEIELNFKQFYLDLQAEEIVGNLSQEFSEIFQQLHDSFQRRAWQKFLEILVKNFLKCIFISLSKIRYHQIQDLVEKIEQEAIFLDESFQEVLFSKAIKNSIKPLYDLTNLLRSTMYWSSIYYMRHLRIFYGAEMTEKLVQTIYGLKNNFDSSTKKSYFQQIKDEFKDIVEQECQQLQQQQEQQLKQFEELYNVKNNESFKQEITLDNNGDDQNLNETENLIEQNIQVEDDDDDINKDEEEQNENNKESEQEKLQEQNEIKARQKNFVPEGFLLKKSQKGLKKVWERRYFRLLNGVLYWYKDQDSTVSQNKIVLSEAQECQAHKSKDKKFKLTTITKTYKLQTETELDKGNWIRAIRKVIFNEDNSDNENSNQEIQIIKCITQSRSLFFDYDQKERKEKANQKKLVRQERDDNKRKKEIERQNKILDKIGKKANLLKQQQQEISSLTEDTQQQQKTSLKSSFINFFKM